MLNAILGPKRIKITYMVGVVCGGLLAIYGFFNGQPMIGMFMGMFGISLSGEVKEPISIRDLNFNAGQWIKTCRSRKAPKYRAA